MSEVSSFAWLSCNPKERQCATSFKICYDIFVTKRCSFCLSSSPGFVLGTVKVVPGLSRTLPPCFVYSMSCCALCVPATRGQSAFSVLRPHIREARSRRAPAPGRQRLCPHEAGELLGTPLATRSPLKLSRKGYQVSGIAKQQQQVLHLKTPMPLAGGELCAVRAIYPSGLAYSSRTYLESHRSASRRRPRGWRGQKNRAPRLS